MYRKFLKRSIDIIFSGIAIILLLPVYIIVAILVKINLGSPIIFKQERPGKDGEIFTMYKFRSMSSVTEIDGKKLSDEKRLTKFGKAVRATSLDELPELFNILKGEMSLVGPRPLAKEYLPYYNEREKVRHLVRPGLTGLAQINGRNVSSWKERFENDIKYVENISFKNDMLIILKTIKKVFLKEDIAVRGTGHVGDFHKMRIKEIEEKKERVNV